MLYRRMVNPLRIYQSILYTCLLVTDLFITLPTCGTILFSDFIKSQIYEENPKMGVRVYTRTPIFGPPIPLKTGEP